MWEKTGSVAVGAALLVIAVALQVGLGSAQVVGCGTSTGTCPPPKITAAFSWTASGLAVTVVDKTTWSTLGGVSITVSWGDGSSTVGQPVLSTLHHTYSVAGTYSVTDSATGTGGFQTYRSNVTQTVQVTASGSGSGSGSGGSGGGSCNTPTQGCAYFSYSAFSVSSSGTTATFQDLSTAANLKISTVTWNFGDGATAAGTVGGAVTHTYASLGTYNVTEVISAAGLAQNGSGVTWTQSYSRNVTLTSSGCGSTCQGGQGGAPVALQPLALLLGLTGLGVIISAFVGGWWKAAPIGFFVLIGLLGYILAGGAL